MIYSIPPIQSAGKDATAYWEGFLTDEEINKILAMPEWNEVENGKVGYGGEGKVNNHVRSSEIGWVHYKEDNDWLWNKLSSVAAQVNSQFFKFDLSGFYEPMQLGVYKAENDGHYDWHVDSSLNSPTVSRKLSMCLLLSDVSEFEGGQLQVKTENDDPITLETKKGRAWFFPSYVLHRVTPVSRGSRKSLVSWIGGPEFK